ncbi:MAG: AAA family ATPase, partial [Firmicutes bacterium]|nr:AAA family ATPase [Bacillota bacterium]
IRGQRQALIDKYGEDLQTKSHGESILHVLLERIVPGGVYLLDEPETPFSPQRLLSLLALIKQMAEAGNCQFIIATHSPILLACPGASIYSFDETPIQIRPYEELEHVRLTRDFLNAPDAFLRHL